MLAREVIEVAASPGRAWAYVSDFTTAAEWDPGIVSSRKVSDGPVGFATAFEVVVEFRGKQQPFTYRIADFVEGRRIVLHGEGRKARSTDTITFAPAGEGTQITYEAELTLVGVYRLTEPFLRGALRKTGANALAGLKAKLDAPA